MGKKNLSPDIVWRQKGDKIFFEYKGQEIYFIMPKDYNLSKTSPDLLKLAEWLMFSPWYPDMLENYHFTRNPDNNIGLAFSGGVDSTAVMMMLPKDTKIVYTERHGISDGVLNQDNAIRFVDKIKAFRCKTNFEIIRTFHGLQIGYSTALCMGVPLVLLADYYNLGRIAYGKVFDDQYFPHGIFRDYTKDYILRNELFDKGGVRLFFPTVGCSEVITTKIVDLGPYKNLAFSCLRGAKGKQCNNCFKCFRKNVLRGKEAVLDRESYYAISKNPPKMCTSLMYALNKKKVVLPPVKKFSKLKLDLLEKYYPNAYDVYDAIERDWIENKLRSFDVNPMNKGDITKLKKLDFRK